MTRNVTIAIVVGAVVVAAVAYYMMQGSAPATAPLSTGATPPTVGGLTGATVIQPTRDGRIGVSSSKDASDRGSGRRSNV